MFKPNPSRGRRSVVLLSRVAACGVVIAACLAVGGMPQTIRFATFNVSLYRSNAGDLIADLAGYDEQASVISRIIEKTQPDVLLVNEFDYDSGSLAAEEFRSSYIPGYEYMFLAPSNTGIPSGFDLDNDGAIGGPGDALGYGAFPGQYGMVLFSKYPILEENVRTFRSFLWKDMPGAVLPSHPATGQPWFSLQELQILPLSSKSHWDIPILIGNMVIHVLACHPTPPMGGVCARRNHDEIRFWADYITLGSAAYMYDDQGGGGGFSDTFFVIMGDMNADPVDGTSFQHAIDQLLNSPLVNPYPTPCSEGGAEQAQIQKQANTTHLGDPAYDTADFTDGSVGNLRVDYVLPSATLDVVDSGVFWPLTNDLLFSLVGTCCPFPSSDHRLVWADIAGP